MEMCLYWAHEFHGNVLLWQRVALGTAAAAKINAP